MKRLPRFILFILVVLGLFYVLFENLDLALNLLPGQSERVKYERSVKRAYGSEIASEWVDIGEKALTDYVKIDLPFREDGVFIGDRAQAYGYRIKLKEGQKIDVRLDISISEGAAFIDFFQIITEDPETWLTVVSLKKDDNHFEYQAQRNGVYFLRIHPLLEYQTEFSLVAVIEPSLIFPVKGKGNQAIQSFWGAPRDGGRRKHEGIDIFAAKGTPVLASVDGRVSRVRNGGLGGKTVNVKASDGDYTLYYAHLDQQTVSRGQYVRAGDQIGTVGNTGNARTTPPHLHFGIYKTMQGPVDPLAWVKIESITPKPPVLVISAATEIMASNQAQTALRSSPNRKGELILTLGHGTQIQVLGISVHYYHVRTQEGVSGYVHSNDMVST